MHDFILQAGTVFMGFFAIMNPIANAPVFLSLTAEDDTATRKAIALRSVCLAFVIVAVFSGAGRLIFELFGITLFAFRITGGALVFLIGFHMLQGQQSSIHNPSTEDNEKSREAALSIAVSPLAVPILAGPGTIATAMSFATEGGHAQFVTTVVAFALLCIVTYLFFVGGERLVKFLGESALKVVTRMMGLILAVIGTQMLIAGVTEAVKRVG